MTKPPNWQRGDKVRSGTNQGGLVLGPDPRVPLDRTLVHWPEDGEIVWSEKVWDLELDD